MARGHLAVPHDDDLVGEFQRLLDGVRDEQDSRTSVAGLPDLRVHGLGRTRIEATQRAVEEEDLQDAGVEPLCQNGLLLAPAGESAERSGDVVGVDVKSVEPGLRHAVAPTRDHDRPDRRPAWVHERDVPRSRKAADHPLDLAFGRHVGEPGFDGAPD